MTTITLHRGETGETFDCDLIRTATGLRLIDPSAPKTADAAYVAVDVDDLVEQAHRDGLDVVGYAQASDAATQALGAGEPRGEWRDAGYLTAYDAAAAMIGAGLSPDVQELARLIVAERL